MAAVSESDIAIMPLQTGQAEGKWPERYEIDAFCDPANARQVFLFFAALTELQKRKTDDPWSYFQLAGIHSMPYRQWPPKKGDTTNNRQFEYCAHWNTFFPGWHRVYCFQFERALHDIMMGWVDPQTEQQKANSPIPEQSRGAYYGAAETWRLPFWDLATTKPYNQGGLCIPKCAAFPKFTKEMGRAWEALSDPSVKDAAPQWLAKNPDNPLYSYRYPSDSEQFGLSVSRLRNRVSTSRHPASNGITNINALKDEFYDWTDTFRADIITNMTGPKNFYKFVGSDGTMANLQGPHGLGHVHTGGDTGGNMTSQTVAAFDPIFWLHHCNIDRLIALWQAGHPGPDANYWVEAENDTKPLRPFYDNKKKPWTSARVRNIKYLGYTYGVLEGVNNEETFRQKLNDMYSDDPKKRCLLDVICTAKFQVAEKGPFLLKIYWKKGQSESASDPLVGQLLNFVADIDDGVPCVNCEKNRQEKREGTIGTNIAVRLQDTDLIGPSFRTMNQAAFQQRAPDLAQRLYWRVFLTKSTGNVEIPVKELTSLKVVISVIEKKGVAAGHGLESGAGLEAPLVLTGATEGKDGGVGPDDDLSWLD